MSTDDQYINIERLRNPIDWKDLDREPEVRKNIKIRRAKELGVVAVLFDDKQVSERISELAFLERNLRNGVIDETVYATILRGGVPFAAPFFGHMASLRPNMNPIVDYVQASRYGEYQQGSGLKVYRKLGPKTDIAGKTLMLVDDVTDEGLTLEELLKIALDDNECHILGDSVTGPAKDVGAIVLGDKQIGKYEGFNQGMVLQGFWLPNAWAGGVGLDGPNEFMRWMPELVLTAVQHEKYRESMPEILDKLGERAVMGMDEITWIS